MKAYLSIDLDYWDGLHAARAGLNRLLGHFPADFPVLLVGEHHKLLKHANEHPADLLIHIDRHSDYVNEPYELNCGTWISPYRIKWSKGAVYQWYHDPLYDPDCGRCDTYQGVPFDKLNKISRKTWKKIERRVRLPDIKKFDIQAIGISISYDYLNFYFAGIIEQILEFKYRNPDRTKRDATVGYVLERFSHEYT